MHLKNIGVIALGVLLVCIYSCNQSPKNNEKTTENKIEKESKVYQWRGENRSGIYNEHHLLKSWPDGGPIKVWEYEGIGNGYGSPIFTADNMYVLGEIDSLAFLFAFDSIGNFLWRNDFGKEWTSNYRGSRSTPTIVDDLIYVTSGMGNLFCFNRKTGEKIWSVDMINELHGSFPLFGYSESVIVEDSMVFCTPGGADTNVVALNRFSGGIIWISKGVGERPGYNSPQIIKLKERNILVNFTAYQLMGHDTKTGELLWVHNQDNIEPSKRALGMGDTHSNTIIFDSGFIYYAAGDGNGGVKLALSDDGKSVTEVWRNTDFDSFMGGIVKLGNHLYGSGTAKPDFKSINAETGKLGNVLKIGSGAVIASDSMLFYYNQKGEVLLLSNDPLKMEVVSKFKIKNGNNEHFAHPVINKGKLYIRHGNVIQAFNISE